MTNSKNRAKARNAHARAVEGSRKRDLQVNVDLLDAALRKRGVERPRHDLIEIMAEAGQCRGSGELSALAAAGGMAVTGARPAGKVNLADGRSLALCVDERGRLMGLDQAFVNGATHAPSPYGGIVDLSMVGGEPSDPGWGRPTGGDWRLPRGTTFDRAGRLRAKPDAVEAMAARMAGDAGSPGPDLETCRGMAARALSWLADEAVEEVEAVRLPFGEPGDGTRVIATFVPQAWGGHRGNTAVGVEPQGPTEWDVTEVFAALTTAEAREYLDDGNLTDALAGSARAPRWVRDWDGPFEVDVETDLGMWLERREAVVAAAGGDERHGVTTLSFVDPDGDGTREGYAVETTDRDEALRELASAYPGRTLAMVEAGAGTMAGAAAPTTVVEPHETKRIGGGFADGGWTTSWACPGCGRVQGDSVDPSAGPWGSCICEACERTFMDHELDPVSRANWEAARTAASADPTAGD